MITIKHKISLIILLAVAVFGFVCVPIAGLQGTAYAANGSCEDPNVPCCGAPPDSVNTSIDLGCQKKGSPVTDFLFAVIRFLTAGVGIVVIGSVIVGGIQYTTSQGNPQAQGAARGRVINALIALLLYLLIFALVQWLVPGGFLNAGAP